jgi:hypothetical protein
VDPVLNLEELACDQDLRLSILDPAPNKQGGLLTLKRGETASARYQVFVQPCTSVTCTCHHVRFRCRAISAEDKPAAPTEAREFWLDVQAQKVVVTAELEKMPESMRLAEDVAAALTAEDWQRLYRWLGASKLELIAQATAADVHLSRLPDATGGRMVPFVEIFPFGLALYFTLHDEFWAADEMYCVQPDCDCKDTILSFFKLRDGSGVITKSITDPAGIRYNYRTGLAREAFRGPVGNPPYADLLAALQKANPLLNLILEHRHLLMQNIYLRQYVELLSEASGTKVAANRKVGRNERCPCGSGKKFKHCCLGKI